RPGALRAPRHPSRPCPDGFSYASDTNTVWLNDEQISELVAQVEKHLPPDMPKAGEPKFIAST
ncbi:MAG: hypothetical protein ACO3CL_08930, partial [Bacteroidia bacterium]